MLGTATRTSWELSEKGLNSSRPLWLVLVSCVTEGSCGAQRGEEAQQRAPAHGPPPPPFITQTQPRGTANGRLTPSIAGSSPTKWPGPGQEAPWTPPWLQGPGAPFWVKSWGFWEPPPPGRGRQQGRSSISPAANEAERLTAPPRF